MIRTKSFFWDFKNVDSVLSLNLSVLPHDVRYAWGIYFPLQFSLTVAFHLMDTFLSYEEGGIRKQILFRFRKHKIYLYSHTYDVTKICQWSKFVPIMTSLTGDLYNVQMI